MNPIDEIAEKWKKKDQERQGRLDYALRFPESHKYVFLYETTPLDYFEKWDQLCYAPHIFYEEEKKGFYLRETHCPIEGSSTAADMILSLEELLIQGLLHFSNCLLQEHSGDNLKYCIVDCNKEEDLSIERFFVICLKMANNGTCYAFSRNGNISKLIPHDFDGDWELKDAKIIET